MTLDAAPPAPSTHVLIVEDDRDISQLVQRFLQGNGVRVTALASGRNLMSVLKDSRVDLVILDLMLPGEDGLSLCRRVRAAFPIPIIMLTAKAEEVDRVVGLEMGADDYVTKPFSPRELLARIRAVLRRGEGVASPLPRDKAAAVLTFEGWRLMPGSRRLLNPQGAQVSLTGAEFALLLVLCQRAGRILSRDQLLDLTQGRAAGPFERSIDVIVSRLRQKMERDPRDPDLIKTIRSGGYVFVPEVTAT